MNRDDIHKDDLTCGDDIHGSPEDPTAEDKKREYMGEFWNDHLTRELSFKEKSDIFFLKHSQIDYFRPFFTGKNCIDVGCGLGYSIWALEDQGLDVDGLEPDPKAAEVVNKSIKRGKCYAGFYDKFSSTKKYDVVWLSHTLEHVEDPIALLEKCYDVTAENGILCLMIPDCTNPETKKNSMENRYHISHFTSDDIKALVKKTRYEAIKIQSFKRVDKWTIRFHKLLLLCKMSKVSLFLRPYFPFVKTDQNDGYELRAVLKKNNTIGISK